VNATLKLNENQQLKQVEFLLQVGAIKTVFSFVESNIGTISVNVLNVLGPFFDSLFLKDINAYLSANKVSLPTVIDGYKLHDFTQLEFSSKYQYLCTSANVDIPIPK